MRQLQKPASIKILQWVYLTLGLIFLFIVVGLLVYWHPDPLNPDYADIVGIFDYIFLVLIGITLSLFIFAFLFLTFTNFTLQLVAFMLLIGNTVLSVWLLLFAWLPERIGYEEYGGLIYVGTFFALFTYSFLEVKKVLKQMR